MKTEAELFDMLSERYCEPRYVLLPRVRNATGWKGRRTADAVAISLWPSDGLEVVGFEMKSSRSDWLRELRNPRKREAVGEHCDRWVIVAGGPGIVRTGEVEAGTGWMEAREGRLHTVVAGAVSPGTAPAPLDRAFVGALVRRALACSPHGKAIAERVKELVAQSGAYQRQQIHDLKFRLRVLEERLKRAEAAERIVGAM